MRKWNVGWGTVSKCNMNCQFCYSKQKRIEGQDLTYNQWVRFIDENHERINSINYGTGENTLDKDWFHLVKYIRDYYPVIRQALTTNGHLAKAVENEFCMSAFVQAIDEVDVSLDFADREQHNAFRGEPHAYDWAIATLALCKEYGKSATIVFLGSKVNVTESNIDGLFKIAKQNNAILRMNMYRPTEGINDMSARFIIDRETVVDTLKYIGEKYRIISLNDALLSTILSDSTVADPSGDRSIRVLADGSITPSTYLISDNYIVANIAEHNVLEKLENEHLLDAVIKPVMPLECNECAYKEKCAGGVYDRRYLWYGTLEKKDPYCPHAFATELAPEVTVVPTAFHSVHDGYLPTIFFSPEEQL